MIDELCLMDLLKEEKDAVFEYNAIMSGIEYDMKLRYISINEEPENREFLEKFYDEEISRQLERKVEAEKKIKESRQRIKEYFSRL